MWSQHKARAVWLFGGALLFAGVLLALHGAGLFLWQYVTRLQFGSWVRLPATLAFSDHAKLRGSEVDAVLGFIPQFAADPQAMGELVTVLLDGVHIGLVSLLLGLLTGAAGVLVALRSQAASEQARQLQADRLRRVQAYRRH